MMMLLGAVVLIGVFLLMPPAVVWLDGKSGYVCARCGAREVLTKYQLFGMTFKKPAEITDSKLTTLHKKYICPCNHDWLLKYADTRTLFCSSYGNFLPGQIFGDIEKMAIGIERLPTRDAKISALVALGEKSNLLHGVAERALIDLSSADSTRLSPVELNRWWQTHSNMFVPTTNAFTADQLAPEWWDNLR